MSVWKNINNILARGEVCVLVSVLSSKGSVPRTLGAHMVVTAHGYHGTIGGGALEWQAQAQAQKMLRGAHSHKVIGYALGPDLGQCCGGHMQLYFELIAKTEIEFLDFERNETREVFSILRNRHQLFFGEERRQVIVFGAGHVGRAMMLTLANLPFDVVWIDDRANAFPPMVPQNVITQSSLNWSHVRKHSVVFVMTHSHALDQALTEQALCDHRISKVGVIGSVTKRTRFAKRLRESGLGDLELAKFVCPIGIAGITSKLPQAIAISAAAQALQWHEELQNLNSVAEVIEQHG